MGSGFKAALLAPYRWAGFPLRLLGQIFAALFGRLSWNPPPWLARLSGAVAVAGGRLRDNPRRVKRQSPAHWSLL